jgi:hypothetical protein
MSGGGGNRSLKWPRWISFPLIGFLGFIAFNATVVFGDPRAIGICASAC